MVGRAYNKKILLFQVNDKTKSTLMLYLSNNVCMAQFDNIYIEIVGKFIPIYKRLV